MTCKHFRDNLLSPLVDGEVSDNEREEALLHIAECEECKKEYEKLVLIRREFRAMKRDWHRGLADSTMKRVYEVTYPQKKTPFILRHVGLVASLFIIALLFVFARVNNLDKSAENALFDGVGEAPRESAMGEPESAEDVIEESTVGTPSEKFQANVSADSTLKDDVTAVLPESDGCEKNVVDVILYSNSLDKEASRVVFDTLSERAIEEIKTDFEVTLEGENFLYVENVSEEKIYSFLTSNSLSPSYVLFTDHDDTIIVYEN